MEALFQSSEIVSKEAAYYIVLKCKDKMEKTDFPSSFTAVFSSAYPQWLLSFQPARSFLKETMSFFPSSRGRRS